MNPYENLIARLDAFVRKYYANQLLRGILVVCIGLVAFILALSLSEYFLYLAVWIKLLLLSFLLLAGLGAIVFWIIKPLVKMAKMGKRISHEQAAIIIGQYFPEVSDQLLNILQLKQQGAHAASAQLIEASIGQKMSKIAVVPIAKAIDFKQNKKYLPILLPLLLLGAFILYAAPNVFREASERLLQPTKTFIKPAPFQFNIQSGPLQVVRNADYTLKLRMSGDQLPASVSVVVKGERIAMMAGANHTFEYSFRNCTEDIDFNFYAASFFSESYQLKVLQRPVLTGMQLQVSYPKYTGRKDELKNGISDLVVPVGTELHWLIKTEQTDLVQFQFDSGARRALARNNDQWAFQCRLMSDTNYTIRLRNNKSKVETALEYKIQVIPDQYPVIQMHSFWDTVSGTQTVLNGTVGDDYGIVRVQFQYKVLDEKNNMVRERSIPIPVKGTTVASFQYYFDIATVNLQSGEQLQYYVEVWDNDGVHGSKSSRSELMTYRAFTAQQIDSAINKSAQQINAGLSNSARQNEQMKEEMQSLQSKMLQSKQMDWQQKQALQELAKLQEQMKSNLEQIKKRFEEQQKQTKEKPMSEDLKEKQEALKEQMDNLLNKELKEQMKKLQEMMQHLDKDKAVEQMQQMQEENKLFSMDMERLQALMKQLELQIKMEDLANKLDQLAQKQNELKQKTDEGKESGAALSKEQAGLKKELEQTMKKEMAEMKELAKEIQKKQDIQKEEQQGEQAADEMKKSEEQLEENQNGNAQKSQSKAAQNLEDMAKSLRQKAGGAGPEQIEMDIRAVRQVLSNLMRLSFAQEQLIQSVKHTATSNPAYISLMEDQNSLHGNSLLIRDSLYSLSKRLVKLAASINKETNHLEKNMRGAIASLEQRNVADAATKQQYVMTHTNNLALMLNEILSNLMEQQSQSQKGQGKGQCNKPGGLTPKPGAGKQLSDIISKQKGLGQQMSKGKEGQPKDGEEGKSGKKGKAEGQGASGDSKQNGGNDGNAKELVRMAQQQAAIRRQLAQLNQMLNSQGNNSIAKELQELQEQMDKNETDLVNRKLDGDFYLRQKEILTRMLTTEESLREQEQDDKRSSKNPEPISRPVPPELKQYLQENQLLKEQYKTVPPSLKPYYKNLNEIYFKQVGQ